ncbi:uncharacterized protein LOC143298918 [Babylonia areolata]|uniref:uncharacterized protein LOC143298918 n=1 Tax=Babylonia areolata TaxID=304850 RepID=UPI003FD0A8F4
MGPGRTQESIVVSRFLSSLPSAQRPLLISGTATGSALTDRSLYSNFFRVIPPDSTQVQVLLRLLQKLGWNYISIVYNDDAYGREAAQQLRAEAASLNLCVPSFAALPLDSRSQKFISDVANIIDRLRNGDSSLITGVVFIGSANTAKELLAQMDQRATFVRFIFSEALGLQSYVVQGSSVARGALVAAPPYLPLPEFRAFWNSMWTNRTVFSEMVMPNAWLADFYAVRTKCSDINDVSCWTSYRHLLPLIEDDTQWLFEYYQVKATAVFAAILKQLHTDVCGPNFNGVCSELKQQIRNNRGRIQELVEHSTINLEREFSSVTSIFGNQTSVGFDERGEVTSGAGDNQSLYNVFNYRDCGDDFCFQKVGTYEASGELDLDTETLRGYTESGNALLWPNFPKAQCSGDHDCLDCLPPDLPEEVVFVPGDFYIVAVAPVYDKLDNQPLKCGNIRASAGADFVQSVMFALQKVNAKDVPFEGYFGSATLGVIIINSCVRELVVKERLISLHKGSLVLPDGRNSSEILPFIAGYVGGYFSTVSVAMYQVLSSLDTSFVMVSPANTSPELSDRSKYPLYLRLTSGKDSQVQAILKLVRFLGHQYLQVLYNPDDVYSLALKTAIDDLSSHRAFNICVVNAIASDDEETNYYSVLDDLRKNAWAPLVVVTLQQVHIEKLLSNILPQMSSSDRFRFLGTDGWARATSILKVPKATRLLGSISTSIELPLDQLFQQYFREETDPLTTANPWLKYFWEARKDCFFDGSFQRKGKSDLCPSDLAKDYVQDIWVPFYIQAIYAFASGLNSAMNTHCGQASLCNTLTAEKLWTAIRNVRIDLDNSGVPVNVFDENGDGDLGFKLFQVAYDVNTPDPDDVTYVEVGRYERGSLSVQRDSLWILDNLPKTTCPNPNTCNACFPTPTASPVSDEQDDSMSGSLIGTIVVIVVLVILAVVLIVVLVVIYRRLKAQRELSEKLAFDNLAGPRPSEARPLPPIHGGSGGGSTMETTLGSGGSHRYEANAYDYLHADGTDRSSQGYHRTDPRGVSAGGSSGSSGARSTLPVSVNSAGYVSRDVDGRWSYEDAQPPFNRHFADSRNAEGGRQNSQPGFDRSMQGGRQNSQPGGDWGSMQGGRQNSQPGGDWGSVQGGRQNSQTDGDRSMQGGRQNSQPDGDRSMQGGRQNSQPEGLSVSGGGSVGGGPFPMVFENAEVSDSGSLRPPEPCGSASSDGYLTPMSDDYLTPK